MSSPLADVAPAFGGAASTTDAPPLVLHWVFGHLRKRGSFEDYLVAAGRMARQRGLAMHIVARSEIDPRVRGDLADSGVTVDCVPDADLNALGFFIRTVRRLRPTLVHCHFGSPSTALALAAKALGVKRFVFTDHGSRTVLEEGAAPRKTGDRVRHLRRRLLARFIDLYLPVSGFVGAQVRREVGAPPPKVQRLFNGIDLARFQPVDDETERDYLRRAKFGLKPGQRCVLYVGQLTEAKGVDDLLAIQDEVLRRHPDVAWVWVGDGALAEEVLQRTSARALYLGLRSDVDALLPAADLIVAPSRWHEAFCLTVAEAAACGVPAVATTVGGVPEVVADGETGLLVPPGDRAALLAAIDRLLGDEPRRRAMAGAARDRAEAAFSLAAMVQATFNHYGALGVPARPSSRKET
ncbi:MAG: glycosyltransferase family 4 protein [Proteobacteria bacterium]|nr:glycosyltransferase family 4 protein [Pseudomonadota bacterium]